MSELDDLDRGIVRTMRDDGRISNREIARTLGVSEGTVRTRLNRMEEAGRFRLVTLKEPAAFGLTCLAYVTFRIEQQHVEAFSSFLFEQKEFFFVSINLAVDNIFSVAVTKDRPTLDRLIETKVGKQDGYVASHVYQILKSTRFDFHWTI